MPGSNWQSKQIPLAHEPFRVGDGVTGLLSLFQLFMMNRDTVVQAVIPAERTRGPVLLFAGDMDTIWPATQMAAAVCQRMATQLGRGCRHMDFPEAGYRLDEAFDSGGSVASQAAANMAVQQDISRFLKKVNKPRVARRWTPL